MTTNQLYKQAVAWMEKQASCSTICPNCKKDYNVCPHCKSPLPVPSVLSPDRFVNIVEAARKLADPRMGGLVFVPALVDALRLPIEEAHTAILAADRNGELELRPESGLGRLTPEEKRKCPHMDDGTLLSWARLTSAAGRD